VLLLIIYTELQVTGIICVGIEIIYGNISNYVKKNANLKNSYNFQVSTIYSFWMITNIKNRYLTRFCTNLNFKHSYNFFV